MIRHHRLAGPGGLIAAGLLAASAAAAQDALVISNWDGYMAPDAIEGFAADTGLAAELVLHATNEEIMGKLIASGGEGYDVVFVSSPFAEILHNLGLAETLDHSRLPNLANLFPEATQLAHDPGNAFSVPYAWGTTGLCYRSDLVAEAPDSWNDLSSPPRTSPAGPRCSRPTAGSWAPRSSPAATRSTKPTLPASKRSETT
jgi:spermidine/putrescine transport system substrate-binding protein